MRERERERKRKRVREKYRKNRKRNINIKGERKYNIHYGKNNLNLGIKTEPVTAMQMQRFMSGFCLHIYLAQKL